MLIQFDTNTDNRISRIVRLLEVIAKSQVKQTQIAEQSFKEANELRDVTMGMMKRDEALAHFTIEKMKKDENDKCLGTNHF